MGTMRGPILPMGRIQEPTGQDFKHLQKEVSREMAQVPKDIQDAILHNILARLKDREALQDLMDMLDRGLLDHLDGFGGTFLSEMQEDSRNLWLKLRLHIIYPLKAILVLSDTQHELQAWSMEKRILLQQRELVKSILEPNFKYPWNIPFTLDPKLLTTLQEEGVAVTFSLLEEHSLRVAPDSPEGTWDLEAGKPLFALYGSLSALQQLPRPEPSRGRSVQRGLATPSSAR
ncbi:gasdermin-C [Balaenoptera ricei]|uniref:gasdermin-C n=1 Tax=Balaenoptera ricei TaxID=2746895 RepID=UPI0028BD3FC6|nr:gasdermin-C [Balaenoptera ricei]